MLAEKAVQLRIGRVAILAILGAKGSVDMEGFEAEGFDYNSKKSFFFSSVLAGTALIEGLILSMCMPFRYLQGIKIHVRMLTTTMHLAISF